MAIGSLVPVLMLVVFAIVVVAGMLVLPRILAPRRETAVKQMPYESGMDPIGDARGRFDVRFYLVAIVFLLFDVELLFLYPWAVAAWHPAGLAAAVPTVGAALTWIVFAEIMAFIVLLGVAYVYAWRKGVFDWR